MIRRFPEARRRRGRSIVVVVTALALVATLPVAPATARPGRADDPGPITASRLVPGLMAGSDATGAAAPKRHATALADRPDHAGHPSGSSGHGGTIARTPSSTTSVPTGPESADGLVTPGADVSPVAAWSVPAEGPSTDDPSIAASPTLTMIATADRIWWFSPTGVPGNRNGIYPWDLFVLPVNEYYLPPTIAYSVRNGRWIAAMPSLKDESSNCSTGYLNLAISTTSDPAKPWLRVKASIGSAFADVAWLGLSDDKLVVTTNEWDLAVVNGTCAGDTYEGSRIRVVDLADLIDGSTATIRDLGVGAGYYNWYPITAAPPPGSTSSGTTVDLVGEKFVGGGWQNVVYAKVTGSAKANTLVLGGLTDLTLAGTVPALAVPPAIPAIVNTAWFDERMVGVAGRPGRAWFAANAPCTPIGDSTVRACARFVELDTTTSPPTLRQDGVYGTNGQDTFLPAVGTAKDGKVFLRMTRALPTTVTPLDQFIVQLAADQAMDGGPAPVRFFAGGADGLHSPDWAFLSTFALDPGVVNGVLNIGPTNEEFDQLEQRVTRFRGGLTDDPDGTAVVNNGRIWSDSLRAQIEPSPLASSPIVTIRVSAQSATETTSGGERLLQAQELPIGWYGYVDLNRPELGGTDGEGTHSAWIQFGTGDGRWSTPFQRSFQVDLTPPVITKAPTSGFATGYTVGTTAAVRTSWDGTDAPSGIATWQLNRTLSGGSTYSVTLSGATKSVVHALGIGKTYIYDVQPYDLAGNPSMGQATGPWTKPLAYQGTTSAIVYSSGVGSSTSTSYLGGSTRYASLAGKSATFTFTGRSVAFVSTKARTRGKFEVWVDGVKKATVDCYSSTTKFRQIVWAMAVPYGTHKVRIKVLGTAGRPRVDFDAFLKF